MAERTKGLYRLVGVPAIYAAFQDMLGARAGRQRLVRDFIRPNQGDTVLDLGCGTAAILDALPDGVAYVGIDRNAKHIIKAASVYGSRGRFHAGDFSDAATLKDTPYDLILALGLLHHLNDEQATGLLALARSLLAPGGKVFTIDPVYQAGQSRIAQFLIDRDSGQAVRNEADYVALSKNIFSRTDHEIRHDLLRVPYTHCIMVHSA